MGNTLEKLLSDKTVSWFKGKGGSSSFVKKAIVAIAALAFTAYLYYRASKTAKKLAKALHERDLAEEQNRRAELAFELAASDEEVVASLEQADKLDHEIAKIDGKIEGIEEEHEFTQHKIEAIENWADMDRYLSSIR